MDDPKRLAQAAYFYTLEILAENQRDLVMIKLLREEFGELALPPNKIYRSNTRSLSDAHLHMTRLEESIRERMEDRIATLREMEEVFAKRDKEEMAGFGEFLKERMRPGKNPEK